MKLHSTIRLPYIHLQKNRYCITYFNTTVFISFTITWLGGGSYTCSSLGLIHDKSLIIISDFGPSSNQFHGSQSP